MNTKRYGRLDSSVLLAPIFILLLLLTNLEEGPKVDFRYSGVVNGQAVEYCGWSRRDETTVGVITIRPKDGNAPVYIGNRLDDKIVSVSCNGFTEKPEEREIWTKIEWGLSAIARPNFLTDGKYDEKAEGEVLASARKGREG